MDQRQAQRILESTKLRTAVTASRRLWRGGGVRTNTLLALGLWILLWSGYNTDLLYFESPMFSTSWQYFIHGVRAFFPILAGWIAFLMVLTRARRLLDFLVGPLGLLLLFSAVGLTSSMVLSRNSKEALYFGANYLAIVLVMCAIVTMDDALPDASKLLILNWGIAITLTISLLGAIPFVGGFAGGGEGQAYTLEGVRNIYNGGGVVFGMAMTRNTGFARYAAIATLAALAKLRAGRPLKRLMWAAIFLVCFYALILANGRTEVAAFIASAFLVLYGDRSKRVVYFIGGVGVAILLGLKGFYAAFFDYFTRTGRLDITMTGRTLTWHEGLKLLNSSPWIGWGFQADRIYLTGMQHMHNAFLAALVQSGFVGGGALLLAICLVWFLIVKYFFIRRPSNQDLIPAEIPGIFLFITISSITESTVAYYSAAWLLSAPIVVYVLLLNQQTRRVAAAAERARWQRLRIARHQTREAEAMAPIINPPDIVGHTPR